MVFGVAPNVEARPESQNTQVIAASGPANKMYGCLTENITTNCTVTIHVGGTYKVVQ